MQKTQELYEWHVTYSDGMQTYEVDPSQPDGRGWAERESKPVAAVTLFSTTGYASHSVVIPKGAEPVFFRRRGIVLDGSGQRVPDVHCIGWEQDSRGVYLFIFSDDLTLLSSDKQAV